MFKDVQRKVEVKGLKQSHCTVTSYLTSCNYQIKRFSCVSWVWHLEIMGGINTAMFYLLGEGQGDNEIKFAGINKNEMQFISVSS